MGTPYASRRVASLPNSLSMTASILEELRPALSGFAIPGTLTKVVVHERGHIHDTFISTWELDGARRRYLHQRMNGEVFQDIEGLMHNIERVTEHLRSKLGSPRADGELETLELVRSKQGHAYLKSEGAAWRTYHFIENTESFDRPRDLAQAESVALAFGHFQQQLADLPARELRETIPDFFSTPHRLRQFDEALKQASQERIDSARAEIDFVQARRGLAPIIEDAILSGRIPQRIVHGDTKLNNVLFDRDNGRAVCIVDLDTCMPGYSLYDFGDLVRFTAATSAEDERDLSKVGMDLDLYRALAQGYRDGTRQFLTEQEVEWMPLAARLVTFTIGLRFLADHLAGDHYFKIHRPGHNLDRARVQLGMVEDMEAKQAEMDGALTA